LQPANRSFVPPLKKDPWISPTLSADHRGLLDKKNGIQITSRSK
jgi:hypothetical protein